MYDPIVPDLDFIFIFYERDFVFSVSYKNEADIPILLLDISMAC